MFWRDTEWWWYRAPIETQAMMIEMFNEISQDKEAVRECQIWFIKQKQTQAWKTTRSHRRCRLLDPSRRRQPACLHQTR